MWIPLWIALLVALVPVPARAQNITLVSQLDPLPGNNRYGDVWGEGNYAYVGSFSGSGVAIIDISDPNSAVLLSTLTAASLGISGFSPHNPVLFSESTVTTTPSRCSSDPQGRSGCGGTLSPRLHSSLGELGQRSADPAVPQTRSRALEDISQNAPPPR